MCLRMSVYLNVYIYLPTYIYIIYILYIIYMRRARIHVDVFSSGSELTAAGHFDVKMSTSEYIPTETKLLNIQKALEAEVAFGNHVINDALNEDLCNVQKRHLVTASAAAPTRGG